MYIQFAQAHIPPPCFHLWAGCTRLQVWGVSVGGSVVEIKEEKTSGLGVVLHYRKYSMAGLPDGGPKNMKNMVENALQCNALHCSALHYMQDCRRV